MHDKILITLILILFFLSGTFLAWRQSSLLGDTTLPWVTIGFENPASTYSQDFFVINNGTENISAQYEVSFGDEKETGTLLLAPGEKQTIALSKRNPTHTSVITVSSPYHENLSLTRKP